MITADPALPCFHNFKSGKFFCSQCGGSDVSRILLHRSSTYRSTKNNILCLFFLVEPRMVKFCGQMCPNNLSMLGFSKKVEHGEKKPQKSSASSGSSSEHPGMGFPFPLLDKPILCSPAIVQAIEYQQVQRSTNKYQEVSTSTKQYQAVPTDTKKYHPGMGIPFILLGKPSA